MFFSGILVNSEMKNYAKRKKRKENEIFAKPKRLHLKTYATCSVNKQ